jgi:hypothetical protein
VYVLVRTSTETYEDAMSAKTLAALRIVSRLMPLILEGYYYFFFPGFVFVFVCVCFVLFYLFVCCLFYIYFLFFKVIDADEKDSFAQKFLYVTHESYFLIKEANDSFHLEEKEKKKNPKAAAAKVEAKPKTEEQEKLVPSVCFDCFV